jgi:cation:H+ antiporter
MAWLQFAISAGIVVLAAIKLAKYGDAIAYRTKLGGLFVGALLVAAATSLPELLTMFNAINQRHINLTAVTCSAVACSTCCSWACWT